jgi:hypothetical protein
MSAVALSVLRRYPDELEHLPASAWGRMWLHYRQSEQGEAETREWLKKLSKKVNG